MSDFYMLGNQEKLGIVMGDTAFWLPAPRLTGVSCNVGHAHEELSLCDDGIRVVVPRVNGIDVHCDLWSPAVQHVANCNIHDFRFADDMTVRQLLAEIHERVVQRAP